MFIHYQYHQWFFALCCSSNTAVIFINTPLSFITHVVALHLPFHWSPRLYIHPLCHLPHLYCSPPQDASATPSTIFTVVPCPLLPENTRYMDRVVGGGGPNGACARWFHPRNSPLICPVCLLPPLIFHLFIYMETPWVEIWWY